MRPIGALLLALALAAVSCSASVGTPAGRASGSPPASAGVDEERRHEAGAVTVSASWIADTASARVALNTHSVDLDPVDLTELARLRLDGGDWVAPTSWDAPKGGHHRSGTLTFGSIAPGVIVAARVVELEVRDVGAASHLLRWDRSR